jgi:ABC-type uncharacterized transport system substrate-binding protein
MKPARTNILLFAALQSAGALLAGPAAAGDIAAFLSAESGPYTEAYQGFKAALGQPCDMYDASTPGVAPPDDLRYAVAFGARAAALDYPPGTHLVHALTPVTGNGPGWHEICMVPEPAAAIAAYRSVQPKLRRLAVFWAAYPGEKYMDALREAGEAAGVEIVSARLRGPDYLPERLRRLMGKMDAFWLMPDPALITRSSIMVLANFACANSTPFYAPTYALVLDGATLSFAPGFTETGAAAAQAILVMHRGGSLPAVTYVPNPVLRVNEALAAKCGWPITIK